MTDISKLQALLDWKLLKNSHEFPGPDGGTCINEAAVVAAGLRYRPIGDWHEFPRCFSRELGMLLLDINDTVTHAERQKLIPFVLKLAGSRAVARIERKRCLFLIRAFTGANTGAWGFPFLLADIEDRTHGLAVAWRHPNRKHNIGYDQALVLIEQAFEIGRTKKAVPTAKARKRLAVARTKAKTGELYPV